jgi:hypothetical protein
MNGSIVLADESSYIRIELCEGEITSVQVVRR